MAKIDMTHTVYTSVEEATIIATELNSGDDWDYVVCPDPKGSGRAIINIYDEEGDFVEVM